MAQRLKGDLLAVTRPTGGGSSSLEVDDGSTDVSGVVLLNLPAGVVTDDGGGSVTLALATQAQIDSLQDQVDALDDISGGTRLLSGGGVVWIGPDYDYRVSSGSAAINGSLVTWIEQDVHFGSIADMTDDRVVSIYVDDTGTVGFVAGDPDPAPIAPDLDPTTQLDLKDVPVAAASTSPDAVIEDVWTEGSEWTATTHGSGWTVPSSSNPHDGSYDIEATAVANPAYIEIIRSSATDPNSWGILAFYLRSKASWGSGRLKIRLYNGADLVSAPVILGGGGFGFDSSTTGVYQQVVVNISSFSVAAGTLFDRIRLTPITAALGFYLDDIQLVSGGGSGVTFLTQTQGDARYAQRANNLSDLTDKPAALTNIGGIASDGSVAFTADESMGGFSLKDLADPVDPQDAVTLQYFEDNAGAGGSIEIKEADGTPDVSGVSIIQVTDGKLTDNGGGNVSLDLGINQTEGDARYVQGPSSAVASNFALFDGATGRLLKDGSLSLSTDGTMAADSDSLVPSQKAVVTYVAAAVSAGAYTNPLTTLGDLLYGGISGVQTRLAGQTTSTRKFLRQTGTGLASAAPAWDTLLSTDLTDFTEATQDVVGAFVVDGEGIAFSYDDTANTLTARKKAGVQMNGWSGWTPSATGADTYWYDVPYSQTDGTTAKTYNVRRISLTLSASDTVSVKIQVSTDNGGSWSDIGTVSTSSGATANKTSSFTTSTVASGNLVRANVITNGLSTTVWALSLTLEEQ